MSDFNTKAATLYAIAIARKNQGAGGMASSAKLCADDAMTCYERGDCKSAYRRAKDSLSYSVGLLHADYREVAAMALCSEVA